MDTVDNRNAALCHYGEAWIDGVVERGGGAMPPTLGALLRTPKLRLRLLTGQEGLHRRVEWVAVS